MVLSASHSSPEIPATDLADVLLIGHERHVHGSRLEEPMTPDPVEDLARLAIAAVASAPTILAVSPLRCPDRINPRAAESRLQTHCDRDRRGGQGEQSDAGHKGRCGADALEQHARTHRADDGRQRRAGLRAAIGQALFAARDELRDQTGQGGPPERAPGGLQRGRQHVQEHRIRRERDHQKAQQSWRQSRAAEWWYRARTRSDAERQTSEPRCS